MNWAQYRINKARYVQHYHYLLTNSVLILGAVLIHIASLPLLLVILRWPALASLPLLLIKYGDTCSGYCNALILTKDCWYRLAKFKKGELPNHVRSIPVVKVGALICSYILLVLVVSYQANGRGTQVQERLCGAT